MEQNQPTLHQTVTSTEIKSGKSRRGFASMDKERHKLVSSIGGKAERKLMSLNRQTTTSPTSYQGL